MACMQSFEGLRNVAVVHKGRPLYMQKPAAKDPQSFHGSTQIPLTKSSSFFLSHFGRPWRRSPKVSREVSHPSSHRCVLIDSALLELLMNNWFQTIAVYAEAPLSCNIEIEANGKVLPYSLPSVGPKERHRPSTKTKLYCLVTRGTWVWTTCPRLLRSSAPGENRTHDLMIASPTSAVKPIRHQLGR